ncbi:single-stranded-DNA-specific exonuclease RecJ [Brachymonas sp. G13]|uniref:single-stranded-DNA-specific exonuclease RecJ n=1 Tax=Brachymonas TaxID=28219 RepID=UPI002E7A7085|nr:single-stranded-DNA-specific exonuclease RecJ [Brachymonas sp. J145]MEE1652876.1 single-stranded-DNA-specific exonuclease RecJ [Brachymonas sp. J145]
MRLLTRDIPPRACWALEQAGLHPLLARLYAARGVQPDELDEGLARLTPPDQLLGAQQAAVLLADSIAAGRNICIVADYDCDGATACAVALRGLRMLGATQVQFLVPDRVVDGYGLTGPIAERVRAAGGDLLVTVDNGIASVEGVEAAHALGMQVLVTDHHLPGDTLPAADVIVNPNQPGCSFPGKSMAGVGVMFYVLLMLRAELRQRGQFTAQNQPRLDTLLPLVALGTVADVVKLDANNRRMVAQGLKRIRQGAMPAGLHALFQVAGRDWRAATTFDMGFALGPRINAAGRLADMTLGIECLTTDDATRALELAHQLDSINRERRELEDGMREQAQASAEALFATDAAPPSALSVFGEDFHEGVVGIVASRLKDKLHRPIFVFAPSAAPGQQQELKGSGRSIPGFHMRDALDLISKRHPEVILRFGGHAMAAGCTIARAHFPTFEQALVRIAEEWLDEATLTRTLETDGALPPEFRRIDIASELQQQVWGQGFAPPVFCEELDIVQQRLVGERHLKLQLRHHGELVDGIWFGRSEPLPPRATLAYRLDVNSWQGRDNVQLVVEGMAGD